MKRKTICIIIIPVVLVLLASYNLSAQTIAGDWYGMANIQGIELSMDLHIKSENGQLNGTFDVPDQGAFGIPFSRVELDDLEVSFAFDPGGFSFSGITDPSFSRMIGYFKQGPLNEHMKFSREKIEFSENHPSKLAEIYDKEEVYIEMRDGIKLFTSIYTPKEASEPSPILMFRSPYNSEPGGEEAFNAFVSIYYRFMKEGYVLVFQDVRGRFLSEGEYVNVRPFIPKKKGKQIDEASDTYDTAEWLVKNVKNNNGKIGVTGISYPGFYATMAILADHPAIRAVSPQAPVTNWFIGDDIHHNGAFFLIDDFSFYAAFGDPRGEPSRRGNPLNFNWGVEDSYEYFMRMGPIKNTKKTYPESVTYWYEIFDHPDYDDWWKATDPRPHLKNVRPAVMTVGGWFDAEDLWGALNTYKSIEEQNSSSTENFLVMGPWSHGQWAAGKAENLGDVYWGLATNEYYHELELKFFNHYLKDKGDEKVGEANMFVTGANEWVKYNTWPPEGCTEKTIYFQPSGGLSFDPPTVNGDWVEYVSDPFKPVPYREDVHLRRDPDYMTDDQRFAARRPDVMVYQTDALTGEVTLTGPLTAELYITTTGTDADFVVKLIDVFPDQVTPPPGSDIDVPLGGFQMLVRGEVLRGKFRNSFEKPEPFVPGEITRVTFSIPDVAHTFKPGHRIMVQVQNSWFPLVDRNPQKFVNIYECNEDDFQKATMRIYNDSQYPSGIKVTVKN